MAYYTDELKFKINEFEGPLDLLLHLIDKNKYSIFDIPIVEITEQYLDYVSQMEKEDLNIMSEFLVMAGTLLAIKAKMLLPKQAKADMLSVEVLSQTKPGFSMPLTTCSFSCSP